MKKEKLIKYNKTEIINSAKLLFKEKGIEGSTVDDIAKASDYSKSTIYVYFKNKEDIYNHIILEYMSLLKETVVSSINNKDTFTDKFYCICNSLTKAHSDNPLFFESMLGKIDVSTKKINEDEVLKQIYIVGEEIIKCIENIFINGVQNGEVRVDIDIKKTSFVLWINIASLILVSNNKKEYIHTSLEINEKEFIHYGFEIILDSVLKESCR